MPAMTDLMPWAAPGVKPNRTWVYAPEEETLRERWDRLVRAPLHEKSALLKETASTRVDSKIASIPGMVAHSGTISSETGICPELRRVAHRSFDRKWAIPDVRLHHRPSPPLWLTASDDQVFVVEQHAHPIVSGPALVFTSLIPDMHYHSGRGGRVLPLYRDAEAVALNITPGLLRLLSERLNCSVSALDLVAYIAAVAAHPAFTRRFSSELKNPGIRIPLTADSELWDEAVNVGQEVLWLHTYGERCVDPSVGRPQAPPRMNVGRPTVRVGIPDSEGGMPELISHDENASTLCVGEGRIEPVAREVWSYEVSGMQVVKHWFGYRKKNPSGKRLSPLDDIGARSWTPAMTTELLDLLNVLGLCVALEPRQETILDRVVGGPLITVNDLTAARVLPVPAAARKIPKLRREDDLFSGD